MSLGCTQVMWKLGCCLHLPLPLHLIRIPLAHCHSSGRNHPWQRLGGTARGHTAAVGRGRGETKAAVAKWSSPVRQALNLLLLFFADMIPTAAVSRLQIIGDKFRIELKSDLES